MTSTQAEDFNKPGHVFPLVYTEGGLRARRGHTEAAGDLCKLIGCKLGAALSELRNPTGTMMTQNDCRSFSKLHRIPFITITEMVTYMDNTKFSPRHTLSPKGSFVLDVRLPLLINDTYHYFDLMLYKPILKNIHHLVFTYNIQITDPILTRVHSGCLTGDLFNCARCDCGHQLRDSFKAITNAGSGLIIYMGDQEGRGIGLANKLRAYKLQIKDKLDTIEANRRLGYRPDYRSYDDAKHILDTLGILRIKLLTNNPDKIQALDDYIDQVVPLCTHPNVYNEQYLHTKAHKCGHSNAFIIFYLLHDVIMFVGKTSPITFKTKVV